MFRISYLWSIRRLRQIWRILRDDHQFSVEVCLLDNPGTRTAAGKTSRLLLDPTLTSTRNMDFFDRLSFCLSMIWYGHTQTVLAFVNQTLFVDVPPERIYPQPLSYDGSVCVSRFTVELPDGESAFLRDNEVLLDKLQPVSLAA